MVTRLPNSTPWSYSRHSRSHCPKLWWLASTIESIDPKQATSNSLLRDSRRYIRKHSTAPHECKETNSNPPRGSLAPHDPETTHLNHGSECSSVQCTQSTHNLRTTPSRRHPGWSEKTMNTGHNSRTLYSPNNGCKWHHVLQDAVGIHYYSRN